MYIFDVIDKEIYKAQAVIHKHFKNIFNKNIYKGIYHLIFYKD